MDKENKTRYNEKLYSKKFYSKKFSDEVSKNAYLKACKWLAKYVLSKEDLQGVEFGIEKISPTTFELSLYAVLSESEIRDRHCKICKETHSSFYISEETNCNWCKLKAFHKREDEQLKEKIRFYKERLNQHISEVE